MTYALKSGFADGRLAPKPKAPVEPPPPAPKPDKVQQRYARMVARRDKWAGELERAKRLHAKAEREVRRYERRHKDRVLAPEA